jgi:hypothetical protein
MTHPSVERTLINKHVRYHHSEVGEYIQWFEFLPFAESASAGSVWDDVYNEGSHVEGEGRTYHPPKVIPTIYVTEAEDDSRAIEDGRQPHMKLHAVMLYQDVVDAGLTNPYEYQPHINDMVHYDYRWYKLRSYQVRGRMGGDVLVAIDGYEVYLDQEFVWDPGPVLGTVEDVPWPPTFPS